MASRVNCSDLKRATTTWESEDPFKERPTTSHFVCGQFEHGRKYPYTEEMGLKLEESPFFANYPLTRRLITNPNDKLKTKVSTWVLRFFSVLSLGILPATLLMGDLLILKKRERKLALPPIDGVGLSREQAIYRRICAAANFFWGLGTHKNLIISLLERGRLKNLEEIHTFLINEVVKMYVKKGVSKQKIVKTLKVPFTRQKHPLSYFFDIGELISKYESGMSNQKIFSQLAERLVSKGVRKKLEMELLVKKDFANEINIKRGSKSRLDANFIARLFFWGGVGEMAMRFCLEKLLYDEEEKKFLNEIISRFLNGESREEISKDLGLPSASYIYELAECNFGFSGDFFVFTLENWKVLTSMTKESLSERLDLDRSEATTQTG